MSPWKATLFGVALGATLFGLGMLSAAQWHAREAADCAKVHAYIKQRWGERLQ